MLYRRQSFSLIFDGDRENIMSEIEKELVDQYLEHELHSDFIENCSRCYAEVKRMQNVYAKSALTKIRKERDNDRTLRNLEKVEEYKSNPFS